MSETFNDGETSAAEQARPGEQHPQPAGEPTEAVIERIRTTAADVADLSDVPLADHVQRFEQVHSDLQAALTEIDGG